MMSSQPRTDSKVSKDMSREPTLEQVGTVKTGVMEPSTDYIDDSVLRANGHSTSMRRQFGWISGLALGFSITNSWAGYLSNFGQNLHYGGSSSVILGLVVAFFAQGAVTLGLSELGSAFPSSGGQYHFVYIISPEKSKRFAAYVVGWMSVIAWWTVTCSGISLAAQTVGGLAHFWYPDFTATQWQIYLIYVAVSLLTIIPLFAMPSRVSWTVQVALYLSILGCALFLIITCAMHGPVQPASSLTKIGLGDSGWSDGFAWTLGIANAMYAFGATDGAIHISEEITQAGRRVPQVMIVTMIVGLVTTLPLMIALCLFMTDMVAVRTSPLPSMEIVYQATRNAHVTTFLIVVLFIVYLFSLPSQWITCGRIAWAFARDKGMPYADFFSHVDRKLGFPVRTTIAALVFSTLYGLLYIASTTAFNSIVTSAVLFLNVTYAVPQGILLVQGRTKSLPSRYLNLGWIGYCCNVFSVLWTSLLLVIICFPPAIPVAASSMNYTSVVFVALLLLIIVLWALEGKRKFEGPKIDWALMNEANQALIIRPEGDDVFVPGKD